MDIAQLKFKVDHREIEEASARLKNLGNLANQTQNTGRGLGSAFSSLKNAASSMNLGSSSALDMESSISGLAKGIGGLVGVAASAAVAVVAFGEQAAAAADATDEMAQKMGVSVQRLEQLTLIANENGGSVEGLQRTYDKLSKSLNKFDEDNAKTSQSFKALGLSQTDLANKTEQEVAGIIIKRWEELGRTSKSTAAVMQLIGGAFRDQVPAIRAAAEQADIYRDRVSKFGSEASPTLKAKGGEQEVALSNLGLAWKGLGNEVGAQTAGMKAETASWAASIVNSVRTVLKEFREVQDAASAARNYESLADKKRLESQAYANLAGTDKRNSLSDLKLEYERLRNEELRSKFLKQEKADYAAINVSLAERARLEKQAKEAAKVDLSAGKTKVEKEKKDKTFAGKDADGAAREYQSILDGEAKRSMDDMGRYDAAEEAANREYQSLMQRVAGYRELADPMLVHHQAMEQLVADYESGAVSADLFAANYAGIQEAMSKTAEGTKKNTEEFNIMKRVGDTAFQGLEDSIVSLATNGQFSFKTFTTALLKDILRMIVQLTVVKSLMSAIGIGSTTKSADGNVFGSSGLMKSASGNVFDQGPVLHGFKGGVGMLGEAGPEAIMPLKRGSNGKLGVQVQGGYAAGRVSAPQITLNVSIGSVDSPERQAKLLIEMQKMIKSGAREVLADEQRPGGMLTR
jgi:lambda family phage tail tape measure protein